MQYKNTKTNVVIKSNCTISGGDWVLVEEVNKEKKLPTKLPPEPPKEPEKENTENQNGTEDENLDAFNGITVAQIKQELDAFGIEYDPKAKKQELYDLMMQSGK